MERNQAALVALAARLRADAPPLVITCARGSSDHAAAYGKYLIETLVGVPVASAAPSVASLYNAPMTARGALMIVISQSGRSPDLLATIETYRAGGAYVLALVNDTSSPLAELADLVLPLHAGAEQAVAATKSCIATLAGLAALVAAWSQDERLAAALETLPATLERSLRADWSAAVEPLAAADRMLVIGRGYSFGIAQEAALKLKETCAIQAEAFSSAEARHGPMRLIEPGYPVLGLPTSDQSGAGVRAAMEEFSAWGAITLLAGQNEALPVVPQHPALEPIGMLLSFYAMVEALARRRGMDPDRPPRLQKVTRTL